MNRFLSASALLILACLDQAVGASEISPAARQIAAAIDSLDVEQHWPAGLHVNWETGVPDGRPAVSLAMHTHCSAFVASAAKHLGIYILRPPEHSQTLLANAQYDWLASQGTRYGWQPLGNATEAQDYANRGYLVVATYRNHRADKPGHIAIIRPSEISPTDLSSEGPQVTQAGNTNYRSISIKRGFAGHPAAEQELRYYAHAVDPGYFRTGS